MEKILLLVTVCILILCSGCSELRSNKTDGADKNQELNESEIHNEIFVDLENVNTIYTYNWIGEKLCTKKKEEISELISLLQSLRLESIGEQDGSDGQLYFQLNQNEEKVMDVIYASKRICVNGEWYSTEDTDIMEQVEDMLMSFEKC